MNHSQNSPIASAIKQIVDNANTVKIFSYREEDNFKCLWGLEQDVQKDSMIQRLKQWAKQDQNANLTVVIVWDGMPQTSGGEPLNVRHFVSPHDWAMAASWHIYNDSDLSGLNNLKMRVLILDVRSPEADSGGWAGQSLFAFQNALPWIQDYRIVGSKSMMTQTLNALDGDQTEESGFSQLWQKIVNAVSSHQDNEKLKESFRWLRQAVPPEDRDMEMFVEDLLDPSRVLTTHPNDNMERMERSRHIKLTKNLWEQELLKAETRHSVANLVAPTILADGLPLPPALQDALAAIAGGSLMRRALISTLREAGFLKTDSGDSPQVTNDLTRLYTSDCVDVFGRRQNIRYILVDDHFDLGYHHILGYTILGPFYDRNGWNGSLNNRSQRGSLECHKNLDWLIKSLNKRSPICDWDQPRYLFENKCDVLFLDLRLWDEEETRTKVIKDIICAADRLLGNNDVHPKLKEALEKADEAVNGGNSFPLEALTLLPLLLSCIDRTLPIVLFTSSHQRVVTEMLQDFPNVITSFVKPLISGYGEPISPADSVSDLEDAIKKAIELHEARIAWKRICELMPKNAGFDIEKSDGSPCNVTISIASRKKELRSRLADMFKTCVFGDSCYESIDEPWEFLESEISRCIGDYKSITPKNYRGEVADALKQTRIEKTHGKLNRNSFRDVNARRVALLQILFLLDFLEGNSRQRGSKIYLYEPEKGGPEYVLWCLAGKIGRKLIGGERWDGRNLHKYRKFLQNKTDEALQNILKASLRVGWKTKGVVTGFTHDKSQAWIDIGVCEGLAVSNGLCQYDEVKVKVKNPDENPIKLEFIEKTGNNYGSSFRFPYEDRRRR